MDWKLQSVYRTIKVIKSLHAIPNIKQQKSRFSKFLLRQTKIMMIALNQSTKQPKNGFIKRQTSGTSSDSEWQRVGTTTDSEWQRVTINGNEWQRATAVVQRMKTAQYTSKNGWLPSFQWQKQMHYYFKGWMARVVV